jgi:outer membrane protein TolC
MTLKTRTNTVLMAFVLCGLTPALAQVLPLWMNRAVESAPSYLDAQATVKDQQRQLDRLQSDALATALERKAATSSLALGKVGLIKARLTARKALMQEYFSWLEAEDLLNLATLANAISRDTLKAAQSRFKAGAINAIDQAKAENNARSAMQDLQDARTAFNNVEDILKTHVGSLPDARTQFEPVKPRRDVLETGLPQHPQWLAATIAFKKAETDFLLKNNEFSARVEIDIAENNVVAAQRTAEDAKTNVRVTFKLAWDTVNRLQNIVAARTEDLNVAQNEYTGQQFRFDKGLIPRLNLQQSQLTVQRARAAVSIAQHQYVLAVLDMALSANADLWKN